MGNKLLNPLPITHYPLVVIVGPTASGKSKLALQLAQQFNGEIVCADSRTVYQGLDIGTAKPSPTDRALIRHHLLDMVEPGVSFSAAQFKDLADTAIADIQARGKIPFLVGGTGLYIDAVLYNYQFPSPVSDRLRISLQALTTAELQRRVKEQGIVLNTSDQANRQRLVRALETAGRPRSRSAQLRPEMLLLGLVLNKTELQKRITQRIKNMLSQGFLEEVNTLIKSYGIETAAGFGIGYRAFSKVVSGRNSVMEANSEFIQGDMNLAKRQLTWFKRNPDIHWIKDQSEAERWVEQLLTST